MKTHIPNSFMSNSKHNALSTDWEVKARNCPSLSDVSPPWSRIASLLIWAVVMLACACKGGELHPQVSGHEMQAAVDGHLRPNIIFILADDLGFSDLGCFGGEIQTPNLDRLAAEGMRFTQMYNNAKCTPSRAALLTGLYPQQTLKSGRYENAATLGEVLRSAGYRTYAVGKHHGLENLFERGFDHFSGMLGGASNHFVPGGEPKTGVANKRPATYCFNERQVKNYISENKDFYTTDNFTTWAIEMVKRDPDRQRPFFLYLAYTAPHDPLQAPQGDIEKYRGKYLIGYEAVRERRYAAMREKGIIDDQFPLPEPAHKAWSSLSADEQNDQDLRMATYAAMIDRLDQNVGRLLEALRESQTLENTLIFFASDNGSSPEIVSINETAPWGSVERWSSLGMNWANVSNTPFRYYKNSTYNGGITSPLIAWWPEVIKAGEVNHEPVHFIDVMPTLVELSGATYPSQLGKKKVLPMEGISILPALVGQPLQRSVPLYFEYFGSRAMIQDGWKLVQGRGLTPKDVTLFHLLEDRTETRNLVGQEPERVRQMERDWHIWYRRVAGEEWNPKNPTPL